jgi:hypothetical protein
VSRWAVVSFFESYWARRCLIASCWLDWSFVGVVYVMARPVTGHDPGSLEGIYEKGQEHWSHADGFCVAQ